MNKWFRPTVAAAAVLVAGSVMAEEKYSGYLCCNMRTDGNWISDINYAEAGKRLIPAGTPVTVTGYGRHRVRVEIDGKRQVLGNDYSRDMSRGDFAKRYVVTEDPSAGVAAASPKIQDAIRQAKLTPGMTRDQVIMSVGYPVTSENPDLNANLWRFWLSSFAEFQVHFDGDGLVSDITTEATTRNLVWMP